MTLKQAAISTAKLYLTYITEFINSDSKKEKLKDNLTDMKDYYQKGIERKTGIELGEINVKLSSELPLEFSYNESIEYLKKAEEKDFSKEEEEIILKNSWINFGILYLISKPYLNLVYFDLNASWSQKGKLVIFSDTYPKRILNKKIKCKNDSIMIHELSHALWGEINPQEEESIKNFKYWSEGFAEYGLKDYFKDLILPDHLIFRSVGKVYQEGYKKVKQIIEKHGLETYLEIPNRWQEFDKELSEN